MQVKKSRKPLINRCFLTEFKEVDIVLYFTNNAEKSVQKNNVVFDFSKISRTDKTPQKYTHQN